MNSTEQLVNELVPQIYEDTIKRLRLPLHTDMSRSNQCHNLSLDLYDALNNRGLPVRRELHKTGAENELWHYVVAHTPIGSDPTSEDIITDLNPWQYPEADGRTGHLHGERGFVLETLIEAGAPEWFVSLRGLTTIAEAHTTKFTPFPRKFPS